MTKSEQYYVSKVANLSRKRCVDGELIDSNIVGFKVYDENGKELRFSRMSTLVVFL